jgi:hypothetical protein
MIRITFHQSSFDNGVLRGEVEFYQHNGAKGRCRAIVQRGSSKLLSMEGEKYLPQLGSKIGKEAINLLIVVWLTLMQENPYVWISSEGDRR